MADEEQINEVQEKLDELAGSAGCCGVQGSRWASSCSGTAAVLTLLSCLIHAVDDGELTLDLGKKKKKKKKDAAAEPAVSTCRARVTPQQPRACLALCVAWQLCCSSTAQSMAGALHGPQHEFKRCTMFVLLQRMLQQW
jgi:hypothetical protein